MVEKVKLVFNEKDLKQLISEKYNLKFESVSMSVSHFKGDAREPEYTSIVVEGVKDSEPQNKKYLDVGTFRKMTRDSEKFKQGDIVKICKVDYNALLMTYCCKNKDGVTEWLINNQHEPTNETF